MKHFEEVTFSSPPTMLAAWPGMGNVGLITVDYLRRTLGARLFAEIDMSPFFIPDSIIVKDGIAQFPDIPSSVFHYTNDPDLIIFESNAQIGGKDGITIIKTILEVAKKFNVPRIFTSAAFAQPASYQTTPKVLCAANTKEMQQYAHGVDIEPMPDGAIAGLNGLLLGVAAGRGINAACILGTIPSYATNISYPKASYEIIKKFRQVIGRDIELAEIEESVAMMDKQLETIEQRIKEFFSSADNHDEEISSMDEEKVPNYIMEKIEQLFNEVRRDRSKAPELKNELDRWNLYELYENRFLDLFRDKDADKDK